ncbi:heat-inducible transcriptional repressor HrcA [Anaeromicrobium sediminis]|uniref:Heat-inducible transcription repressor HrcA n=1 Tax=Anaeromicrobium sediminis TaxID=1478221 RepID=A0A267MHQ8_9FIRM|nr:heat-inducible transcriptional repressor HrcA [Anaeromicrobium sediminis]PAB58942.1 heat-inducible transcription repressor HrcA [Anaeromicrobium sediminis]
MELEERKLKILQAIIRDFIETAEPVGSRTLAKKYNLGVSSATIRNEMSDLEDLGYLSQPYTSAGRVPSDKAYRLYVDNIIKDLKVDKKLNKELEKKYINSISEIEQAISQTAKFISKTTKLTSVALSPQLREGILKGVKLVPIDPKSILLIIVSETGEVKNTIIRSIKPYNIGELELLSNILESKLKNLRIGEISPELIKVVYEEALRYTRIVESIFPALISTIEDMINVELYLEGIANILDLPEYHDIEKAKKFMKLLGRKDNLISLLLNSQDALNIKIGKENEFEEMKECSLITATYKYKGLIIGKIGVIGPTRMDYNHITSVVSCITNSLSKILKDNNK